GKYERHGKIGHSGRKVRTSTEKPAQYRHLRVHAMLGKRLFAPFPAGDRSRPGVLNAQSQHTADGPLPGNASHRRAPPELANPVNSACRPDRRPPKAAAQQTV